MAQKRILISERPIPDALALADVIGPLLAAGRITRTQASAVMGVLRGQTPLALTLAMRRPKGVVTVMAAKPDGETIAFRVNVRAKVLPG